MEHILALIDRYTIEVIITIAVISLLSLILVTLNSLRITKTMKKYKRLMRGAENKTLELMLHNHIDTIQDAMTRIKEVELSSENLALSLENCIQRVGVVRYNAFEQMGGDQSYSIALLNNLGNGIVLTGLYGRNSSTSFAKPVINGKSTYKFSSEEEQALKISLSDVKK